MAVWVREPSLADKILAILPVNRIGGKVYCGVGTYAEKHGLKTVADLLGHPMKNIAEHIGVTEKEVRDNLDRAIQENLRLEIAQYFDKSYPHLS